MNEYRVISAKVLENWKSGVQVSKTYFYPQYRNNFSISRWEYRLKCGTSIRSIPSLEEDEEGWWFFNKRKEFDSLESAYAYLDRLKEVNEYGRKIHPYPVK
jgi:hypothetical protein